MCQRQAFPASQQTDALLYPRGVQHSDNRFAKKLRVQALVSLRTWQSMAVAPGVSRHHTAFLENGLAQALASVLAALLLLKKPQTIRPLTFSRYSSYRIHSGKDREEGSQATNRPGPRGDCGDDGSVRRGGGALAKWKKIKCSHVS